MILRLFLRESDIKKMTMEEFEIYRDYYFKQRVRTQGRRGGRTEHQIISEMGLLKNVSFFDRFFRNKKVQTVKAKSDVAEDREILNILRANAKGRRISICNI